MKTETNNIKRNTLRRMAAVAMLLIAFTVSAEAQEESYYCPNCKTVIFVVNNKTIKIYLTNIHYFGNCTNGLEINGICMKCNKSVLRTKIDPIPHDWGDATHVDPTCTENGGDRHTCNRCGATETYNEVAALGHLWGSPFDYVAPTCTTAGGYHHTCQRDGCGVTELDNRDPALGHEWGEWSTVAPTCTEQGYDWRLCTRCDAVDISNYVDPLGHTWGADYRCIRGDAELPAIAYVKADGTEGSHQAIPITGSEDDDVVLGFENGDTWYYLSGDFNLHSLSLIDRTANIILTAGCKNTILGGINAENGSLNIYTQSGRGILHSAINTHGDVHIHGGYVNAYNSSVGGDLVLGWTNTNDQFRSSSISAGGTITIAEGKAMMNIDNKSEIFYGDGTAIDVANISGKILDPKTDVLCYYGADDHAHFLNEGDYTVLTTETAINPESSSADAVQWLVVRGNVEFTGDLSLCGTTHLILLDDAVLTASSNTTYALYTEKVTNIYGSTKGNGRIEVTNGDLYAGGLLNIYGGNIRVSGTFKGRGTKNFSWTRPGNSIYANNYENSAPNLAKPFTDGDDIYYGSLTADNLTAIAGKTLQPCVLLTVGADNDYSDRTSELGSWAGKDMTVAFQRAFTDGAASTVCLPFPMTSITGGNVYGFRGITWDATLNNEGGWVATMIDQSPEAGNLLSATEANKPYLFMPNATGDVTFTGTIASVPAEITAGSTTSTDTYWTFQGTYSRLAYGTDPFSDTVFGFAASTTAEDKEKGQDAVTAGEFVKAISGAYIPAFRAFLKYSGSDTYLQARGTRGGAGIPETITVRLIGKSGEIDGIGEIRLSTGEVTFDPNAWYDLNGRKLDGKPSEKGIYINGGRKVVIK